MNSLTDLTGTPALVTGASRGFGRAAATALCEAGAQVVGIARGQDELEKVRAELGDAFTPIAADAADPIVAERLIRAHRPRILVLNAGVVPVARPIHEHTWETFSRHWEVDVQHVFHWTRLAISLPLDPGSVVVAVSSGAALGGSPVSGGYAGAKATIRFLTSYAAEESERGGLGITFLSVLPGMTPGTGIGNAGIVGYAARQGVEVETYLQGLSATLSPDEVGRTIVDLARSPVHESRSYRLAPGGPFPLD